MICVVLCDHLGFSICAIADICVSRRMIASGFFAAIMLSEAIN